MPNKIPLLASMALALAALLPADTMRLHDGRTIDGTFIGGDSRTVRFMDRDRNIATYNITEVDQIIFANTSDAPASSTKSTPSPFPSTAPTPSITPSEPVRSSSRREEAVTIPAGTALTVRLIDSIDSDVTGAGERFRASIDDPIVMNGYTIIPRGADATVQVVRTEQAGAISGSDEIALKLESIRVGGQRFDLASDYAEVKGDSQGKKTAKTTAVTTGIGAALGAVIGGGKGAAIGAGAGAATGVAVSAARGKTLRLPSETRLDFVLRTPLTM